MSNIIKREEILDIAPRAEQPIDLALRPIPRPSQSALATIAHKATQVSKSYKSKQDAGKWAWGGTIASALFTLLAALPPLPNETIAANHARVILSPIAAVTILRLKKSKTDEYVKAVQLRQRDKAGQHERAKKAIDAIHNPSLVENFIQVGEKCRIIANILNSEPQLLQVESGGQKTWNTYTRFYFFVVHSSGMAGLGLEKKIQQALATKESVTISMAEGALCVDVSRPLNECTYPKLTEYLGTDRHQTLIPIGVAGDQLLTIPLDANFNGGWVTGMSGAGKSYWAIGVMQYLGCRHDAQTVQYSGGEMLFGAKAETFRGQDFEGDPHLFCPFAKDFEGIIQSLAKIIYECRRRARLFNEARVSNIDEWNNKRCGEYLPKILYFIDEPESIFDQQVCPPHYFMVILRQLLFIGRMCRSQGAAVVFLPKSVAAGDEDIFPTGLRRTMGSVAICLKAVGADGCITLQATEEEEEIARSVAHLPGRGAGYARVNGSITRFQSLFCDKPANQMPIVGLNRDLPPDQTLPSFIEVIQEFSTSKSPDSQRLVQILDEEGLSMKGFIAIIKGEVTIEEIRAEQERRMKLVQQSEADQRLLESE